MNIEFVDLKRQYLSIQKEMDEAIFNSLHNTAFIGGEALTQFETAFANYAECKYCVPVANGTDALEIAMKALGIGSGDEVIVPANSFVASAEAVSNCGATVVFCDVDKDSYNIDVNLLESLINSNTKAIMPVHLYGRIADMKAIQQIAQQNNLLIIEDASQGHGARYHSKMAGYFGDVATYSFYPGKNLGAYGDAGAIVTNNELLYNKAKRIANHGRIAKYNHEIIGRNSRMDALQATVLSTKLPYLNQWIRRRRAIAQLYHQLLKTNPNVQIPKDEKEDQSAYHLYVIRVAESVRAELKEYLKNEGIATGIHYPIALHQLEAYKHLNHKPDDFPVAQNASKCLLSLPIYAELTDEEVRYIANFIKTFFDTN